MKCAFAICPGTASNQNALLRDGSAFPCCDSHHAAIAKAASEAAVKDIYRPIRVIGEIDGFAEPYVDLVYFMRRQDGHIKIGFSGNVEKRKKELERHFGSLDLLLTEEGGYPREQQLHRQFAEDRADGDWFRPSDPLEQYLMTLVKRRMAEAQQREQALVEEDDEAPITLD
jgi:hypothetical protein